MAVAACCCSRFTMGVALALAVLASSSLFFVPSSAELQRLEHPLKSDGSLSLLVVGDWGRKGEYNQTLVAHQMGIIGEELDIDFVISTGDNFYDSGLSSVNDEAFQESFTNIYTAESLQKPWYTVLGNHDYEGDALAQFSPMLRELDSRWVCIRSFILNAEIMEFFFVDTTPFVKKYWKKPSKHIYDWRGVAPREQYVANLLKDVNSALQESSAKWKIVVGHHTIRSVSKHGDTEDLQSTLLPILKSNGVDFYVNGHDHCLQCISSIDSPLQFLTSGGGSKAWRGEFNPTSDELRFFYDGQGFMSLHLTKNVLEFVFYDAFGRVLDRGAISKDLDFTI